MIINHNLGAMNAQRNMNINSGAAAKSMEKLSSGLRINRAGDDAAGLSISEKMRAQIRGLNQASTNAEDGISMIQTTEGALNETHSILQRMRELAVQSANDTNTDDDRAAIQKEVKQLQDEVDRISENTEFNTKKLLNGELSGNSLNGTGSQIGTATSASLETGDIDPGDWANGSTTNFQVNLDGNIFDLTGVDDTDTFAFFKDLQTKLDAAVDAHNSLPENKDNQVVKAKFEIDVTDESTMNFKITSGTTGSQSKIEIKPLEDDANTTAQDPDSIQEMLTGSATSTKGSDGKLNEEIKIEATDKLQLEVNGHKIDVNLATAQGTYNADSEIAGAGNLAGKLKEDIQKALDDYKKLTGTDFGNVDVQVKDGALVISSDQADTTNIKIKTDEVSNKLGLAGTSTSSEGGVTLQIGANADQNINVQINDMSTSALKIADIDIATQEGANNAITSIDDAIKSVSSERSKLGAVQNRLEHTINNLGTSSENLTAAESRIRDTDMAAEMSEYSKNNILQQAAQAMLAQAKSAPQSVLQLLG